MEVYLTEKIPAIGMRSPSSPRAELARGQGRWR